MNAEAPSGRRGEDHDAAGAADSSPFGSSLLESVEVWHSSDAKDGVEYGRLEGKVVCVSAKESLVGRTGVLHGSAQHLFGRVEANKLGRRPGATRCRPDA